MAEGFFCGTDEILYRFAVTIAYFIREIGAIPTFGQVLLKKGISVRIRNCRTTVLVSCLLESLLQRKRTAMNLSQSTSSFQRPDKPVHDGWIDKMSLSSYQIRRFDSTPFLERLFSEKGVFILSMV